MFNETMERSNKWFDIFISFEIQIEKKLVRSWGKAKKRKIKNHNKQKEKMNERNKSNIRVFNLKSNSHLPKKFVVFAWLKTL